MAPNGRTVATGSTDRTATLWDVTTGKLRATLRGHSDDVMDLAFSPDGKKLATSSRDRRVHLWDVESGKQLSSLPELTGIAHQIALSPDGTRLAMLELVGGTGSIRVWDLAEGKEKARHPITGTISTVGFTLDGKNVVVTRAMRGVGTGTPVGSLLLWGTDLGRPLATLK